MVLWKGDPPLSSRVVPVTQYVWGCVLTHPMGMSAPRLLCSGLGKHLAKQKVQSAPCCHSCGDGCPENEVLFSFSACWAFYPHWEKSFLSWQSSPLTWRNASTAMTVAVTMTESRSFSCYPMVAYGIPQRPVLFLPSGTEEETEAQSS